jgi:serine/threonine protein kinase
MESFGRYRVLRTIGQGGMAEVLEALAIGESGFKRRVAIKRIRPDKIAPELVKMFLDEARISSQLHHANIVSVLDYGIADAAPFQVLELIDGSDTHKLMLRGAELARPLPSDLAVHVATEVAHALAYAHEARDLEGRQLHIVHRDVSRVNILISWAGDVKLSDFGIAVAAVRAQTTLPGMVKGNRQYMAPEQAIGGDVDRRADIFALGCVLHALLVGTSPLKDVNFLAQLAEKKPLALHPDVPHDIRPIIEKATRLEAADRYPDAALMAGDLGRALARRLDEDAKTLLKRWLDAVRPPEETTSKSTGRLDALVDVDLILAGTRDDMRSFETKVIRRGGEEIGSASLPRKNRRVRAIVGLIATLALVAGAALVGRRLLEAPIASPLPPASEREQEPKAADRPPVSTGVEPIVEPQSSKAGEARLEPPSGREALDRQRRRAIVKSRSKPVKAEAPIADPNATGVLLVAGDTALKAEIWIDGVRSGFAPKRLELALGDHRLELVSADGHRIGPATIHLTEHHTRSAPLRWPP